MPRLSAFTPCGQLRCSSEPSLVEQYYNLAKQLLGPVVDVSEVGGDDEAELYATARMCALMHIELIHAGNQANPFKAYDLLPLLENDYLITPGVNDTVPTRQANVAAAMRLAAGAIATNVVALLRIAVGAALIAYAPDPTLHVVKSWTPGATVTAGDFVIPATGAVRLLFECTVSGSVTGATEPVWPLTTGTTVLDGSAVVWQCQGPAALQTVYPAAPGAGPGAFKDIRQPAKLLQLVDPIVETGTPTWAAYQALDPSSVPTTTWAPATTFAATQEIVPTLANACGAIFLCTTGGISGATEPAWSPTVGATFTDGAVVWTCLAAIADALVPGDVIVVEPGNTNRMEQATVLAVANVPPPGSDSTPGFLYLQVAFAKAHDANAPMTTGCVPYWWSTQRLNYIVVSAAAAIDGPTRAKIDTLCGKVLRGNDTWAIVSPASTTVTGGIVGPLSAGMAMGTTPLGAIPYVNSN